MVCQVLKQSIPYARAADAVNCPVGMASEQPNSGLAGRPLGGKSLPGLWPAYAAPARTQRRRRSQPPVQSGARPAGWQVCDGKIGPTLLAGFIDAPSTVRSWCSRPVYK